MEGPARTEKEDTHVGRCSNRERKEMLDKDPNQGALQGTKAPGTTLPHGPRVKAPLIGAAQPHSWPARHIP